MAREECTGKKYIELFSMSLVLQFIKLSLSRQDTVGDHAGWAGTEQLWKEGHTAAQHCRGGANTPLTSGELLGPLNLKICKVSLLGSVCTLQSVHTL